MGTGGVGRADLLRALVGGFGGEPAAVDHEVEQRLALRLGLHPQAAVVHLPESAVHATDAEAGKAADAAPRHKRPPRLPLQTRFHVVFGREPANDPPEHDERDAGRPLAREDYLPRRQGRHAFQPLVARTRLWPALRRSVAATRLGRIDVERLVSAMARGRLLRRLPRCPFRSSSGDLVLVADRVDHLIPYLDDYARLTAEIFRLHGESAVTQWAVLGSPQAILVLRRGAQAPSRLPAAIPLPAPGTTVLILGDLGLLAADRQALVAWSAFCRRLDEAGARVVVWLPCSAALVPGELCRHAAIHCLGDGDLRALRTADASGVDLRAAVDALLTRIACCVRVEPQLLRSLRRMEADTAAEPGLEGLVWGHALAVRAGGRFCELRPAVQADYRARFRNLAAGTQQEIQRRTDAHHAYRGRATESAEWLLWETHASPAAVVGEYAVRVAEARAWFRALTTGAAGTTSGLADYAADLLGRHGGDAAWLSRNSEVMAPVWNLTGSDIVPSGLRPDDVVRARGETGMVKDCRLVQRGDRLYLSQSDELLALGAPNWARYRQRPQMLASTAEVADAWPRLGVGSEFGWGTRAQIACWLALPGDGGELELPLFAGARSFDLVDTAGRTRIATLARPSWALEWGRDAWGLYAVAPSPLGPPVRLYWSERADAPDVFSEPNPRSFRADPVAIGEHLRLGADLSFGLYLDVELSGWVERLRWIEPGEFRMGSPPGELERRDDEGPRHRVILMRGFWLAETACEQGLWEAVTGGNPSRFSDDPKNPVEQVSWDDVQRFLGWLDGTLPGVKADLPTEAEWEYACRAGTEGPFSFGEGINPEKANYDGNYAYGEGPTGEFRGRTVAAKSFEPNAWGLYQMHGNVWEWCADGKRGYGRGVVTDPRGPEGEADRRALRGGSWDDGPWGLRSAFRFTMLRDGRSGLAGFRFALRSTSAGEGAERPPEAGADPEGLRAGGSAPGRGRSAAARKSSPAARPAAKKRGG